MYCSINWTYGYRYRSTRITGATQEPLSQGKAGTYVSHIDRVLMRCVPIDANSLFAYAAERRHQENPWHDGFHRNGDPGKLLFRENLRSLCSQYCEPRLCEDCLFESWKTLSAGFQTFGHHPHGLLSIKQSIRRRTFCQWAFELKIVTTPNGQEFQSFHRFRAQNNNQFVWIDSSLVTLAAVLIT
jgi:hypothetical protein